MSTADAPIMIGTITLTVNDAARVADFYETIVGLNRLSSDAAGVTLGAGDRPLVYLRQDKAAKHAPDEAGLFHTAFLLPSRADLAAWLVRAAERGLRLEGASDHRVSEALYLSDPEGNGIEIYRDRPRDDWPMEGSDIDLATTRLDLDALVADAPSDWGGLTDDSLIGHVHLQVGDTAEADRFFTETLPFKRMARYQDQASFYGAGGYHHHLGANIWRSKGAGKRSPGTTGLTELELLAEADALPAGTVADPWGTEIRVTATG